MQTTHAMPSNLGRQEAQTAVQGNPARLRRANLIVGLIHLAQAIAIFALSNGFKLPISASFLSTSR